jgi:predicted nucleic acid-binding protein
VRVLFDTSVVLDVLENREPHVAAAAALFAAVDTGQVTGLLCATTVTTIHYIARQALGPRKAREQLRKVLAMFSVVPVTHAIAVDALELDFPDYEDAVLHEAAVNAEAAAIVTRNAKDFRRSQIRVYTPVELVTILQSLQS